MIRCITATSQYLPNRNSCANRVPTLADAHVGETGETLQGFANASYTPQVRLGDNWRISSCDNQRTANDMNA